VYKKYVLKNKRRYLVHPFTDSRLAKGIFYTSFENLRESPDKFFNYFRMSIKSFDELAVKILKKIKSTDMHLRLSIPPLEMLGVTLR